MHDFTNVKPLKPLAPYIGGKNLLAKRLVNHINAVPHDLYAEAFVGMGGVFFRRDRRPATGDRRPATGDQRPEK